MYQLDCRSKPLEDKNGNKSSRDICQFVRYKDFRDRPDNLTELMLMIIPSQVEAYFKESQNFVGLSDAGKPKYIYIRKIKEEQEKEKLRSNKSNNSNKKPIIKLTEKERFTQGKCKEEKELFGNISTNSDY